MTEELKSLPSLTMESFSELKGLIEKAKEHNSAPEIAPLTSKSGISEADLHDLLARADEVFLNEEWEDSERRYRRIVQELKLGPLRNQGRLALSLAHQRYYKESIELATKTYKELPAESASYEALALCSRANKDVLQTCLWSRLAGLATSHASQSLQELTSSATRELETFRDNIEATKHLILKPDLIKALKEPHCSGIVALMDIDSLETSLQRVQKHPERLSQEAQRSADLRRLMNILAHDSTSVFPSDYASEHTELKQAQSPFHSISRDVFLKITKNLNVVHVARLRKSCRLFSLWGNHPQYWETILTHYCDPLPEEEWGIRREPFFWHRAVKTLRADLAGITALGKLLVNDSEVNAKMVDSMYPVAHRFNNYESDLDSCGAAAVFDRINGLILSGGTKTANFFVSSTHLVSVLQWFMMHGNDPHHSFRDSTSAMELILTLIMKSGEKVLDAFKSIRCSLPVACVVPMSPQASYRWTLLALILGSKQVSTGLPPSQILPFLPLVRTANHMHQKRFYSRLTGLYNTMIFTTSLPDLEQEAELGLIQLTQKEGSDSFSVEGADTLGPCNISHGAHRLMEGTIEFDRVIGDRPLRFIGRAHPYAFGGAFFDVNENGVVSYVPLGVWAWYRSGKDMDKSDDEAAFQRQVDEFKDWASSRSDHPLSLTMSTSHSESTSEAAKCMNLIRQFHATAVALETPLVTRAYLEELALSLSEPTDSDCLQLMKDIAPPPRFRVETDFKYARRRDLHHRAMGQATFWRLQLCKLYKSFLVKDSAKIDRELDLNASTAKVRQPTTEEWARLLVIFDSTSMSRFMRDAHALLSKSDPKRERRFVSRGKEEALKSDSEDSSVMAAPAFQASIMDLMSLNSLTESEDDSNTESGDYSSLGSLPLASRPELVLKKNTGAGSRDEMSPSRTSPRSLPEIDPVHFPKALPARKSDLPPPPPAAPGMSYGTIIGVSVLVVVAVGTAAYATAQRNGALPSFTATYNSLKTMANNIRLRHFS